MSSTDERFCVPDLRKERANCWFDKEEITNLYDGSKTKSETRRALEREFFSRPELLDPIPTDYMSHEDLVANDMRKSCRIIQLVNTDEKIKKILGKSGMREFKATHIQRAINADGDPISLHFGMFIPAFKGQCNEEQKSYWLPKAESMKIIGTYAQTELGHGTYLSGLETTATFDPSSDEFIFNSPTLTSYKFWPGGLGKSVNHAIVMAQLYTRGKCYGPHPFIVQLRDTETHKSLPGVILNEIGPKMGFKTYDNGSLGFKDVRVPRTNMLMKYSQVLKDGSYIKPPNSKLGYGTMVGVRVMICNDAAKELAKAATIAVRYSAVRRQSKILPDEPEPQILDYQTQQYKLIPQIASVFAILFSSRSLIDIHLSNSERVAQGNFELLPQLHALSCGMKAQCSFDGTYGIDTCRLACGGNGYIASSNFPRLFVQFTPSITYEGENTVLLLQTARYIFKSHSPSNRMSYFFGELDSKLNLPNSDLSNEGLLRKWEISNDFLFNEVSSHLQKLTSGGMRYELAWNASGVKLVQMTQACIRYFMCSQFVKTLNTIPVSVPTKTVLERLCRLYLLYYANLNQGILLRSGSLMPEHLPLLENEMQELLGLLRKDAVNLVDAFDIHDRILNSTLGSWDGNVYERLYNESLKSPMNQKDVVEAIPKYLQPLMKSQL